LTITFNGLISAYVSIVSYVFIVLGLLIVFLVFKANSFASATFEVGSEQKVISTGAYGVVRHPIYSGALLMLLFTPLALGSILGITYFSTHFDGNCSKAYGRREVSI